MAGPAGIYNFRFHDLRHSAASVMAMAGVETLRYSHLSPGHPRIAVADVDQAIESSHPAGAQAGVTARL